MESRADRAAARISCNPTKRCGPCPAATTQAPAPWRPRLPAAPSIIRTPGADADDDCGDKHRTTTNLLIGGTRNRRAPNDVPCATTAASACGNSAARVPTQQAMHVRALPRSAVSKISTTGGSTVRSLWPAGPGNPMGMCTAKWRAPCGANWRFVCRTLDVSPFELSNAAPAHPAKATACNGNDVVLNRTVPTSFREHVGHRRSQM